MRIFDKAKDIVDNQVDEPMIFISRSNSIEDQCYIVPNLFKVIKTSPLINPQRMGIPNEIIITRNRLSQTNNKPDINRRKWKSSRNILLVLDTGPHDLDIGLSVIRCANHMPELQLEIAAPRSLSDVLKRVSNINISFLNSPVNSHLFNQYCLILSYGLTALEAAMCCVPVLIVGPKGLGGILTKQNVIDFIHCDFLGRIGGALGEEIPEKLLTCELNFMLERASRNALPELLEINNIISNHNNNMSWDSFLEKISGEVTELYKHIYDDKLIMRTIPVVASNIKIVRLHNKILIINSWTGKLIGNIGRNEFELLRECRGEKSLGDIFKYNSDEGNSLDFLRSLWEEKVIVFKL